MKKIGIVGLGKMGGNLALQARDRGYEVVGIDKAELSKELKTAGIVKASDYNNFADLLDSPRIALIYVGSGAIIDTIIESLEKVFKPGDIIIDAGNSYWGDSIRRYKSLKEKGIHFIDCGTSGGVSGARNGACFMVGGEREVVEKVEPLFKSLAVKDGYVYAGPPGTGHFTKLVHNGIEFGMLQAIGEGMDLLTNYRDEINISGVLKCWNHGSVVRSWLMELMEKMYNEKDGFESIPGYIEDTGEVNWLVEDALHMEVPIPVITQSVVQLFTSRDSTKTWARAIAMMRHAFGGHPFGKDEHLQAFRKKSRVSGYPKE